MRNYKSYINPKLLNTEEIQIFQKGISEEADNIIKKYMLDKNGKVAPTTTKENWLKYKPVLKNYLLNRFKDESDSIKEIIYRIINNVETKPKCPCCGNPLPFLGRPGRLYREYCSYHCANSSEKKINDGKRTSLLKFGFESSSQNSEIKKKISDSLKLHSEERKENQRETWLKTLGVDNPMKLQMCKDKSDETKRENNSYGKSKQEDELLKRIKEIYPSVIPQYKSPKYPFKCDFYIPEKDLYIEYQGFWTHGQHPFDENNEEDLKTLNEWKEREKFYLDLFPEKHTTYTDAIYTWTDLDVRKRKCVEKFHLNFLDIWSKEINDFDKILTRIESFPNIDKSKSPSKPLKTFSTSVTTSESGINELF